MLDQTVAVLTHDPAFSCFLLDGQLAMLDDYLAIRPEQRAAVAELVEANRLLIGPWYVLADELLSSDESLVRNLLAGRRAAESLGGWLPLGYSPDAFGHPAAFPTILAGFGIEHGILWRGYGGEPGQEKDLFRWIGPDGSAVLVHHLSAPGYEVGAALPPDGTELERRWRELESAFQPRAGAPVRLLMAGADHHALDPDLPQRVALLNTLTRECAFRIGSPLDYFAAAGDAEDIPEAGGELRFSYRYTWTLQGVHSARTALKRSIAEGDRLLLRWAEPQAALATAGGASDRRLLLRAAWRDHLLNHPHDTLGGCVTDDVAADVAARASAVLDQARGVLVDALHDRLGQDRSHARRARDRWTPALAVINPRPVVYSGVVETTITVFESDVIVGAPRTTSARPGRIAPPAVFTASGDAVPLQILHSYDAFERLDSPRDYPDQDRVRAFRVALRAHDVPALGLQSLAVKEAPGGRPSAISHQSSAIGRDADLDSEVSVLKSVLRSRWCEVHGDDKAFLLEAGVENPLRGLGELVSERDEGDLYTFQLVENDRPVSGRWSVARPVWTGPLVAALSRAVRVGDRVQGTVTARLDAGSHLLRLVAEGVNLAGNHRLRIRFPLPAPASSRRSIADMQYGPVTREHRAYDPREYPREWPVATAPMHRYVSVETGAGKGMTVFARGAFEYELAADAIVVTLFRAVGDFSRDDLAARPGHAAWPAIAPAAQELGPFRAEFGIVLRAVHQGSAAEEWGALEQLAEEFHAPCAGLMLRYGIDVPASVNGPELHGAGLAFKSLKPAESGTGVVLRCVNLTGQPVKGTWRWPTPIHQATLARLDETPIGDLSLSPDRRDIPFTARPREIVTIIVEPGS
ncbi:MAG: hypothetical protein HY700_08605 [Gemmatimonadetes bacterium]|nr:hypothetical protein [Gemmatimonadota bacterium]